MNKIVCLSMQAASKAPIPSSEHGQGKDDIYFHSRAIWQIFSNMLCIAIQLSEFTNLNYSTKYSQKIQFS